MGEGFGLGDGNNDFSGLPGLADSRVSDAQRQRPRHVESERWPDAGTVLRVLALVVGAIVLVGWVLTALNG